MFFDCFRSPWFDQEGKIRQNTYCGPLHKPTACIENYYNPYAKALKMQCYKTCNSCSPLNHPVTVIAIFRQCSLRAETSHNSVVVSSTVLLVLAYKSCLHSETSLSYIQIYNYWLCRSLPLSPCDGDVPTPPSP